MCLFFFFKQKTAYEMRISDWSSDVCSSDLSNTPIDACDDRSIRRMIRKIAFLGSAALLLTPGAALADTLQQAMEAAYRSNPTLTAQRANVRANDENVPIARAAGRSEEHTSELQSLMRISYAVFCLKKKKKTHHERL